jgi:hypothetical protein
MDPAVVDGVAQPDVVLVVLIGVGNEEAIDRLVEVIVLAELCAESDAVTGSRARARVSR